MGSGQEFDATGGELVAAGDDFDVTGFDGGADDGFEAAQDFRDAAGVGADGEVGGVAGLTLDGVDGGFDRIDDGVDVARGVATGDGGADGATLAVADDDDEPDVEVLDGVFDAADNVVIEDVAGVTQDEEIAEALIEIELGATRESAQVRTMAKGFWPSARDARWAAD